MDSYILYGCADAGSNRIVPATAHAAFWKAAHFLGIKIHRIPVDPVTRKVNLLRVNRAM